MPWHDQSRENSATTEQEVIMNDPYIVSQMYTIYLGSHNVTNDN